MIRPNSPARRQAPKQSTASAAKSAQENRDTRRHVIEAAIQTILEQGFYRASSNTIADRAGVTWGVIQYHFGTREKLMLAVLEEGSNRLAEDLKAAELTGSTVQQRLEQFFDILAAYYASPDYLAFAQVLLNLGHDPNTSAQTRQTVLDVNQRADPEIRRLIDRVFEGTGTHDTETHSLVFHALRGLSISHVVLTAIEPLPHGDAHLRFRKEGRLLARSLSLLIEGPENLE
ncbi:TetR/AcrR family transcriptional regulator [Nocardia sp. BMG111209]|uniref:TetR/AcrR family transcriptional regulator n=1 Tax=Nocardia sp. BMG111209 TaxID=1160137 RepID=UPI00039AB0C0|nr:TetR/AcrR family transcriptional regulator [Nocardia sp. BMG111209]